MKKIFSKEIFLSLVFILSSFFLLSPNIKADTIYTFYSTQYTSEPFYTLTAHTKAEELISNRSGYYYVILPASGSSVYIYLFSSLDSYSFRFQHYNSYDCYIFKIYNSSNSIEQYTFDYNSNLTYNSNKSLISKEFQIYSNNRIDYSLLDTNYEMIYSDISSPFSISYDDTLYSVANSLNYLTLYDILYSSPPIPPDNTPILTDFYTLIIDKFSVIADFFTDNTYLFAIPLIPILILCIYFIKRSLIK